MEHIEIEAKFLEIDVLAIQTMLVELGAVDQGEDMLEEIIFYDQDLEWRAQSRMVRIRKTRGKVFVSYKHHKERVIGGTTEIEFQASDFGKAKHLFGAVGLWAYREQQKKRHTFLLNGTTIEFDTWPNIPTYLEIEGQSEDAVRRTVEQLGLSWEKALFKSAGKIIEEEYHVPVGDYQHFTFSKIG